MSTAKNNFAELSTEKRELLELLLQDEGRDFNSFPLSFAQQRLWFLDQLEPGNPFYNISTALHLKGRLDIVALEQSLNEVAARHEVLRTSFVLAKNHPVQVIADDITLPLPLTDLSTLHHSSHPAEISRLASAHADLPFDLSRAPLLRLSLLRLSPADHVLLLSLHHIISDGWSMGVLVREVAALYDAFTTNSPSPLPALPVQYADFAVWQRQWLRGDLLEAQLSYWRSRLSGAPALLTLPADHPRPAVQSFAGALHHFSLSRELSAELQALSRREGVTLFMTLLAAFQTLLARYTGLTDIVVGTPIANRARAETEALIGFFVNMLVLRTDAGGDPSFRELLGRVRETALGAYAHQDVPFEKLVEELQPERSLSHSPLFQVMFALQNARQETLKLTGLDVTEMASEWQTAKFDLTLTMEETATGLTGALEYNTELFDASTVSRMAEHFQVLLDSIIANPGQSLNGLSLLPATERQRLLGEWNDTARDYAMSDVCIQHLFEAQAERTPDAVAIRFAGEQLTYRELNGRANRVARRLRALGVSAETRVGVLLERSTDMVAALLGILKAGGAYIPLDPTYPVERLSFVLEDARAPVLLTQTSLSSLLPSGEMEVVCLDKGWEETARESAENFDSATTGENLAYVIYTSGSTGQPKGVGVSHRSAVNFLHSMREHPGLTEQDALLAITTLSFDISVLEIFLPLMVGARLELVSREVVGDGRRLAEMIERSSATVLQATPASWRMLLEAGWKGDAGLKILCGGEVLPRELAERLLDRCGSLWNLYGPTETTVWATVQRVTRGEGHVSIGRPIANTQIYLLDAQMQPVPTGVAGELHIGGEGVTRGYLNRPELTAERFVPDPFAVEPGARLYRTGDLARYLPDGQVEYINRLDSQVKVRGFRIELGEIEAVIRQHAAVRDGVVVVSGEAGDQRLVAYTVAEDGAALAGSELRSYLKERLPEYMLPSIYVSLDEMPLTPNGKVDRRALPAPDARARDMQEAFVAARTPVEAMLAGVWREVLKLERVGINNNFFRLGGHSLLVTQVVSRIRELFDVELPLRSMFEATTLAELAERVEAERQAARRTQSPPLVPQARGGALPLSFSQQRLWFLHQLAPESSFYNMPAALRMVGTLSHAALEQCLNEIIRRQEALRTSFVAVEGMPCQVIADELTASLVSIDLSSLGETEQAEQARRLMDAEAQHPFDLAHAPLARARLLKLGDEAHILLFTMHHIISDGWSLGVLVNEVAEIYAAISTGRPAALPELKVQYADYAMWQREWLQGAELEEQLAYWRHQLEDLPTLQLPTDHRRPAVQTFAGATHPFTFPKRLSEQVKELSQQTGATLYMTLLAAFKTLLMRYTGQEDIVVGSPIANRTQKEVEGLIGFFINTLVMRTDVSGNPDFRELTRRVREMALNAYAHQDVPFEKLVEELEPERDLSRQPLFQVMFAVQNAPLRPLELPALTLSPVELQSTTTRFDLELSMWETEEGRLAGEFRCSAEVFDMATIRRMTGHLEKVLENVVADATQPVWSLPLLTEEEGRQLTVEWNDTHHAYPEEHSSVVGWFERQVEQTPAATALIADGAKLTYAELNARANQLAHHLRRVGVETETMVGLYVERSVEMVVGLLGTLKAGATYMPLNPEYPRHRLALMMEDAALPFLVTQQTLLQALPERAARVVCLDRDAAEIDAEPESNPAVEIKADEVAYVIYTSGSAGKPKGVLVEHGNLVHTLQTSVETFGFNSSDTTPCLAAMSFDISLFELLNPLVTGGQLLLLTRHQVLDLDVLLAQLEVVTNFHAVPSLLRQIVSHIKQQPEDGGRFAQLRIVFTGGDAVAPDLLEDAQKVFPASEIKVLYGPTEATIICTHYAVGAVAEVEGHALGRPLHNVRVRLYDTHRNLVPVGVAGELYLGGGGVARGYLNRDDLTRERFVLIEGERYYRTGDRARYLTDGNLEFIGRVDEQVKIRGFRIELGEIETELNSHPSVQEAVAVVGEDEAGEKRLVAYVVQDPLHVEENEPRESQWQEEHVAQWQLLYDETYGGNSEIAASVETDDDEFNIIGWNSSYTGEPIPAPEMREWVENTVERIRTLNPRRVLEIGCGTGLLLLPLAPHCGSYRGTDFSGVALGELNNKVRARGLRHVELLQRRADEFEAAEREAYDVVVINSVVQYFPSVEYLLRVMEGAVKAVAPGGVVFVGDVRSLPLLEAFHTGVETFNAPDALAKHRLRQRAQKRLAGEKELVLDPNFFHALRHHLPGISGVAVELKRGRFHNELTRYRYDVTLRVGGASPETFAGLNTRWADWTDAGAVAKRLRAERPEVLRIEGVTNARVVSEVRALDLLKTPEEPQTMCEIRDALGVEASEATAVDPEAWHELAEAEGYGVSLAWSETGEGGSYDVVLMRDAERRWPARPAVEASAKDWRSYANDPLRTRWTQNFAHHLVPQLRGFLGERLPDYMLPSVFMLLEEIPLTPNGKVDRRALPAPHQVRPELLGGYVAQRTPVEELLAGMWSDLLGLERVGNHDNFFDLGGHSLLITQLLSRVRQGFAVDLPLRDLFEAPTVAGLAERIEQAMREGAGLEAPPIVPVSRDKDLPLSFAQERLWFIDQLDPHSTAYILPAVIRLSGPLNVAAFEQSLNEIVRRHESLRTSFREANGQPVQVIAAAQDTALPLSDLSALTEAEREAEVKREAEQEASLPFNLAVAPLVRARLLRLEETEHVLLFTMHHIISDGWSMGVLVREMVALYQAFTAGQPSPLPELAVQYADFAAWQREWQRGDVLASQISYWKRQLGGELPLLSLPTDRRRPAIHSYRGARETVALPRVLSAELASLSRSEGVTLFMTLLAAFQTLLSRYAAQPDVVVGSPIANRNRAETEPLIGFFVNTLVLRTNLSGDPTFRELLGRVRETALGAYAHQDVPFEKLVEELQPERDASHTPIVQVVFALQNAPMADVEALDLTLGYGEGESGTAKFDLTLSLEKTPEGLRGWLEYRTDLFDATTIKRMLGHFENLLRAVVARPDERIADLPLLAETESRQLVEQWNNNATSYPRQSSIQELFEEQAAQTPDAVALVSRDGEMSYAQLNARANMVARHLRSKGVGAETLVGLTMERSAEMVVALLGILKAGGAYVPFDPTYPQERLAMMLQDSCVKVLVTEESLRDALPPMLDAVVCLDADWPEISEQNPDNLSITFEGDGEQLAYVVYTSGSTGTPKGVAVPHRGVVRLVKQTNYASLTADNIFLQLAPVSFDASTLEIWGALLNGGRCVFPAEQILTAAEIGHLIRLYGVNSLWLTTSLFNSVVNDDAGALEGLQQLLVGGEASSVPHVARAVEQLPHTQLINCYGPTESTTFTSCFPIGKDFDPSLPSIPIGRPIANTQVYILDPHMRLVPVGVAGELYIAGDGLARGYLSRPALTAERFLPNPFSPSGGERLYRTGDFTRWLPAGEIEFLGRMDHQVKVRGFRIELGEVEAVIRRHAAIRECIVVVSAEAGDRRLVAYTVAEADAAVSSSELRNYLKERLPEYMLPSAFVSLDAMPLTPSGKVDRRALPALDGARPEMEDLYIAPRTPVEEMLAQVWAGVLGVERVGVNDDFFELGGHSLLATQLMSRMREAFRVEIPLRLLFESPTVGQLAREIADALGSDARVETPPILPVSREQLLPLSFAQQRLWLIEQLGTGNAVYNVPFAMRLTGDLDSQALASSINEIVARHEALRTVFSTVEGEPVQVITAPHAVEMPFIDLSNLPDAEREEQLRQLVREEMQRPFDLAQGPLLRVQLLRLDRQAHVVLLTMHHIISDGWSMGVLVREVAALYDAFTTNSPSPLPALPVQYADFAVWQRQWLRGDLLEAQLSYWKSRLSGAPAVLQLPTDRARPSVQSSRGTMHSFKLSPDLSAELASLSRSEGVTLFMTLLAAFQTLLSRYAAQPDVVVGSPIANRNRAETEPLIGFFVNTLVLRTNLSGDPTFRELLGRVRETALGAYAHQDVPFEKLVEELQPERSLSHSPLFQVVLVLQNAPMPELKFSGLTLTPLELESVTTHFDLTLSMEETPEGLLGWLEYNTDLFDETTIQRMLGHFEKLLRAVVADPALSIAGIEFLADDERQQLLVEHNQTATDYPRRQLIHEAFEEQAAETPGAIALVFGDTELTYAELNERANQLARYLSKRGVGADSLIGICAERSVELITGLLGILKAGGAYVPLDPSYPLERLSFIVDDAAPPFVLTQEKFADDLPATGAQVISLDADWQTIAEEDTTNPDTAVIDSANLAYIIYTSGSTGTPKGVAVSHGNVLRLVKETNYASFAREEVFLQLAPVSFDASTFEIWGALLNGCRLVVMPPQQPSLEELDAALDRHQVTTLWLTSGLFHQLVDLRPAGLGRLRQLLAGGDVLSVEHVRRALASMPPGSALINGYGPTESTTFTCCRVMRAGDTDFNGSVPIGKPIANTQVYILDEHLRPVPVGVAGELHIAGDGLARGYLSRPALTAEKFIPHPFSTAGGERLYRTGDLTRWLSSGEIEFLGRIDTQVKVRGFRIELGEIEAVLGQHAAVRECVVVVSEETGDKRIVAYTVVAEGAAATSNELRSYLKERLPEYMLPSAFVVLDAMPLTPNGKVDRRALPAPDANARAAAATYVAATTPLEELVAGIWCDVLGLERVGINDNFFELGGHSLLATQVVTRVREALHVNLPLRSLFESATVSEFAKNIEEEMRGTQGPQAPPVARVARDSSLPLSFSQERLWFLDQLQPDSTAYNVSTGLRLSGSLDTRALEASINEIVRRHESLRTSFDMLDGQLVQVIADDITLPLPLTDLSTLHHSSHPAEISRLASAHADLPFDLSRAPLLRLSLLRLSPADHVLLLSLHHIISDGWSMGVLVREVAALYDAFTTNSPSPLPALPVQYADFAVWQRQWLRGDLLDAQLSYWRSRLSGAPALLTLPADHPRPAVQSFAGALHHFSLSQALSAALQALSRSEGVTLFMTLLAAFQTLLARYTGLTDIVVGTPIANRARAETEALIGFFVNMLVLRTDAGGDPTFRELVARVRETALGAYAHQDVPFEKLVEELQPERSLSHSPLFQVEFVLQNAPMPDLKLAGLALSNLGFDVSTTHFDVTLIMAESGEGLKGWVQYNTELFDASTIRRMFEHFTTLLGSIVAEPDARLSQVSLLSASERAHLLDDSHGARADYPRELSIHEAFARQAALTPERIAVVSGPDQLTYRELNRRADALAVRLRRLGVEPETIVGVMMERSTEMIVGLFGILKAGGAYLPLDPQLPAERLSFMLEDANVEVLLTQERLVAQLPPRAGDLKHLVVVDADDADLAAGGDERIESGVKPTNLAYIIYTSGSTGLPKAVMIQHRSPLNLLRGLNEAVYAQQRAGTRLRASVNAPLSFDASMQQLLLLLQGYTLYIIPQEIRADGRAMLDYLAEHEIEVFDCTPSQLGILLSAGLLEEGGVKPSLYLVAGEAMDAQMWQTLAEAREAVFFNIYGPTECTVDTTAARVSRDDDTPHIGRPLANTQIYLLDRNGEPVPAGVAGEIHIGGEGLARGYLNRAELTAERFVPNPFSDEHGARLYRTGDVARYTGDGKIKYVGRLDNQVKVRGFRIELGEIEALLAQHEAIEECVVVVREDDGDKRIVAYLVTEEAAEVTSGEIGNYLRAHLPEYMIPSAFVVLDAMPLTPNGKVDRRALPAPDANARVAAAAYVAATTPLEELVAGIWCDVLGLERVGINDNFFELGGHSLLATQVMTRVRETLSVKLPLRVFFEMPTISSVAKAIERAVKEEESLPLPPLTRVEREGAALPLSFTQQRLWLLDQLTPGVSMYNVPAAIRLDGRLDVAALEQSLSEIVERHEVLRTTFTTTAAGQPVQVIHPAHREVLSQIDLEDVPAPERQAKAQELALEDAQRAFDLSRGPVWRATLLRLDAEQHVLLFTMHHIVSDGWSMGVLIKEVVTLYAGHATGDAPELPELQIQYADYAAWQRGWLQSETLEAHLSYWREQFAPMPRELELPTDFERPAVQTYRGASAPVKVSRSVADMLRELSRREGVTLFMTLLAGFKTLLHRYTAQDDIVVGSPIANRSRSETETLIGCFINTLALRTDLAGSPTFRELLARVRDVTLDAYAHQDLPFELLVGALQPERKAHTTPLFQVWFVLQNTPSTALELPGITISQMDAGGEVAQFDLTLALAETPDGIEGLLIYNRDLFAAETISELIKHFLALLEVVATHPDLQLFEIPLRADEVASYADNSDAVEPAGAATTEDEFVL